MRLGISFTLPHTSPEEWAEKHAQLGCRAVVFPLDSSADDAQIDAYAAAAKSHDLLIAEVGAWSNPMDPDPEKSRAAIEHCKAQLALAERVGARCCVNCSGACGPRWDFAYPENYAPDTFGRVVQITQEIIDAVKPKKTTYALEPMPWMLPDSPEQYLDLMVAIDRKAFAVHMDIVNMINCPSRYLFNKRFIDHCFRLLGKHIRSCHVKDIRLEEQLTLVMPEVPCGEGGLDIAHYAKAATAVHPDMPFIIEHLPDEAAYRKAVAHVQAVCGK